MRVSQTKKVDHAVMAEVALGTFLNRFEADLREPDRWESWHLMMALLAFHRRNYRKALRLTETASKASSARRWSARAMGHPAVKQGVRLVVLKAVFEGLRSDDTQRTLH
jgi:hypothetical protein